MHYSQHEKSSSQTRPRRNWLYLLAFVAVGHAIFTAVNMLTMTAIQIMDAPQIAMAEAPFELGLYPFVWFGTLVYFFGSPIGAMPMVLTALTAPLILRTNWPQWMQVFGFALLGAAFSDFWTSMSMPHLLEGPWEGHVRVVCGALGAGVGHWLVERSRFSFGALKRAQTAAAE